MIPLLVRRAARIEKNVLYQHQHGNLQVKNPASPKFCACFFWCSSCKTVKSCKAAPSAKNSNMFLAHFFSKQENKINNHRVTQVFENALLKTPCSYVGTAEQFTSQIVDSGRLNGTY